MRIDEDTAIELLESVIEDVCLIVTLPRGKGATRHVGILNGGEIISEIYQDTGTDTRYFEGEVELSEVMEVIESLVESGYLNPLDYTILTYRILVIKSFEKELAIYIPEGGWTKEFELMVKI